MKKLIAISVVFALVVGAVFAVDLGGEVIGTVYILQGDSTEKGDDDAKVSSGAEMNRIRLQGEGANDDGTFGGWIRAEEGGFWGHAWWKPIDQLKLWIGSNGGDGFFGKEGQTGWMFYQRASDPGVTLGGANVWGWNGAYTIGCGVDGWATGGYFTSRAAFYGGNKDGGNALYATINPIEVLKVNLEIPFFDNGGDTKEIFKAIIAQIDLNFDFGNIALTYDGQPGGLWSIGPNHGKIFAYFGGSFGIFGLDVGVSFTLPDEDYFSPIAAGLGAKVDITDAFGLKARVVASFAGDDEIFALIGDVLPYFGLNDNLKIFLSAGLTLLSPSEGDAVVGWHINPYVWVGQEWGPTFWAGLKFWSNGVKGANDKSVINWGIPIALGVSF